jgi:hypothetical protein
MKSISIDVQEGDVLGFDADILALKYAQGLHGVDSVVADLFEKSGQPLHFPAPMRDVKIVRSVDGVAAKDILFVGVPPLQALGYGEIRAFAHKALSALARNAPKTRHIALTLHGPGYGLDEKEAFESEVAGLIDAARAGDVPESLMAITFVERNRGRAHRIAAFLSDLLPSGRVDGDHGRTANGAERFSNVGYASETKAHVFVAMPFKEEMDDVYHYGIQSAVRTAGFLCERADLSTFTGDVLDWVRSRIKSSSFVIADLSEANPNVYLEVGYAWGIGVPTVLVVRDTAHLKFDVRSQRCLVYRKIKELEDLLSIELANLAQKNAVKHHS